MALPIRTTLDDIEVVCNYLSRKPTGATPPEARKILDSKYLDGRKLAALRLWGFIEEAQDDRLKITDLGRAICRDEETRGRAYRQVVFSIPPYLAIVERVAHRHETSISATDVGAHWHEHFPEDAGDSDKILNDQAVCFFQIATGATLGASVVGRRGGVTRFEFNIGILQSFLDGSEAPASVPITAASTQPKKQAELDPKPDNAATNALSSGHSGTTATWPGNLCRSREEQEATRTAQRHSRTIQNSLSSGS